MTLLIHAPEKFSVAPGGVLLDLDNTVYPYAPSHKAALEQVREKTGRLLAIAPVDFDMLFERARKEIKARLGSTAASHSRLLYFQRLIELAGLKTQVLTALDLEQTYWRSFLVRAQLFDQVLEFLDDLRLMGVPVVVVTDLTAQIQFRKLVHFGIDHYIDYVVTSEEAGVDKPARTPFDIALEKLGPRSAPSWFIGDDPNVDLPGAAGLGTLTVIQKLNQGTKPVDPLPDLSFDSFADLRRMLKRLAVADGSVFR